MEKNPLEDELAQSLLIQGILAAMPDLPKMYPKIQGLIEMLDKGIEDYLGDSEKMIVLTKKNGVTLLITLDTSKQFTLTNEISLESPVGTPNPVINKFEKTEWKNKLLNSIVMQTIKEKYERMENTEEPKEGPFSKLLGQIP